MKDKNAASLQRALPQALEMIVLVLEAGLDFQSAVKAYLECGPSGALRDELSLFQGELTMGVPRVQALHHLGDRASVLRETARVIIQAYELGSSLGPMLRTLATELRRDMASAAERQAALAPLKLMFPLFVFILPAILLVLFGPLLLLMQQGTFL